MGDNRTHGERLQADLAEAANRSLVPPSAWLVYGDDGVPACVFKDEDVAHDVAQRLNKWAEPAMSAPYRVAGLPGAL